MLLLLIWSGSLITVLEEVVSGNRVGSNCTGKVKLSQLFVNGYYGQISGGFCCEWCCESWSCLRHKYRPNLVSKGWGGWTAGISLVDHYGRLQVSPEASSGEVHIDVFFSWCFILWILPENQSFLGESWTKSLLKDELHMTFLQYVLGSYVLTM